MLDRKILGEVLDAALKRGGDFADIFIEKRVTTLVACEENRIERIKSGLDIGAGIRLLYGDTTAYAYTNKITKEELINLADIVSRAAKHGGGEITVNLKKIVSDLNPAAEILPTEVSIDDKVAVVETVNKAARAVDERIKQVMVVYGDVVQDVTIANSLGRWVEDRRVRTRLSVNAIAADGEQIQTGFESVGATRGFELMHSYDCAGLGQVAANRAIAMLEAKPAPAGKMAVVMAGEAGGTMVHEACGHGLEADLVQKGLSVYAGRKGEMVASELVTVVDDGTIPGKYGTLRFDDEGFPTQKTTLIENGVLKNYMYDYLTATRDKVTPTGNGRRESFEHKPIPRMRNTYIAPGKDDPDSIIKSIKNGLLVRKMGGGQVNTVNGDFVFDVAEGYLIKDGEIAHAVRGATLTGNGPQVLQMVDMVGSDLGFTIGTCGKDGQGAPVSDAQPTMRIPEIIVGGTAHEAAAGPRLRRSEQGAASPVNWRIRRL
ncbi:peptidase U62, modulator of DNA gyrase [Thermosinus carboxydivorans Nor1]|uniref:Peptidase U62, modulator of DNA gyrase n=1 Tax=Thermosinus carboxydivorans Nor1 TaxID=401526 RepID=A1HQ08_9FIRM|nr:TldD/PmbA family protein [Thermosinus carboxydivorans]EAX47859.1 peptidase U62, modulator of DNA gyrase [Thermosinus carboxydivorans Nor1]